jgi:hypothetical protein
LVVVTTDMTVPVDVKEIGIVVASEKGTPYFARRWSVDRTRPVELPASLGVRTPVPHEKVRVSAVAYRDTLDGHRVPFVLREAVTTIPSERVGLLAMPLDWLAWGTTAATGDGVAPADPGAGSVGAPLDPAEFVSKCAGSEPCAAVIDEATLPTAVTGDGPATTVCFDPAACFNHVKPFRFTLTLEGTRCLATPAEAVSDVDRERLNIAVRARNGERWQWQVLDRDDARGWRFDSTSQRYEVPRGLCARLSEDREEMQGFAEGRFATLPERTTLGLFGTFRCNEVKYARLLGCGGAPVGALATGKGAGVRVDAPTVATGTGGGSTGSGVPGGSGGYGPDGLERQIPDEVRTIENRPFFGCGPLEKIGTADAVAGIDALDGGLLVRHPGFVWGPVTPLAATGAVPALPAPPAADTSLYRFAGGDLIRGNAAGYNAVHFDAPTATWSPVPFGAPLAPLLRTVTYPTGVAHVRAIVCSKDSCEVKQDRVASWTFPGTPIPFEDVSLGANGGYPVVGSFGKSLLITPSVDAPNVVEIAAKVGFVGTLQTERLLFAQDGDRLRRFDVAGGIPKETKELPFPLAPLLTAATDRPFALSGGDLVAATAHAGLFVQPAVGDAQLCVPGWRDDGKPLGPLRGFSVGTTRETDNDQPLLRTFVYFAVEATGASPISLYRVELIYR